MNYTHRNKHEYLVEQREKLTLTLWFIVLIELLNVYDTLLYFS